MEVYLVLGEHEQLDATKIPDNARIIRETSCPRMPGIETTPRMEQTMRDIADHYGLREQTTVAIEELSELIKALSKLQRYPDDSKVIRNIIEETGDVYIMMYQMRYLIDKAFEQDLCIPLDEMISNCIKGKINRQIERMRKNE